MEPSIYETSSSLIQRLGNQEPRAWRDFSTKYAWMMRRWLRSWKIPIDQVDDILQETCLRVFRSVHTFERQGHGSFRAWLKEVSRSCWFQVVRKSAYKARMECRHFELESFLSDESLFLIDHQIDLLIELVLFDRAIELTRLYFNDATWNAYRLTMLEGRSGVDTAQSLGISVDLVYKNKQRFESILDQELTRLKEFKS